MAWNLDTPFAKIDKILSIFGSAHLGIGDGVGGGGAVYLYPHDQRTDLLLPEGPPDRWFEIHSGTRNSTTGEVDDEVFLVPGYKQSRF